MAGTYPLPKGKGSLEYELDGAEEDPYRPFLSSGPPSPPLGQQTPVQRLKRLARAPIWRLWLPVVAVLLSATLFLVASTLSLRYIKLSGLYRVPYKATPPITKEQVEASSVRHLTYDQCLATYPRLYDEADRAAAYWEKRGGVSISQLNEASKKPQTARVLIYNGELYVKSFQPERHSRTRSALALINDAVLTSTEPIPNVEFVIHTDDLGEGTEVPVMSLDRKYHQNYLWLMPDYGFNSWPEPRVGSYSEVIRKAQEYDAKHPWAKKIPQLFWKGALMVEVRRRLMDVAKDFSWAKVEEVDWRNKNTVMTMDEHCGYKFLGHVEGFAYSGRLKYILQCRSVVVAHEMEYVQHFHHLINSTMGSPDQNLVVVPGMDWKDLPAIMDRFIEDDAFAEDLADRSQKFWSHYISKASADCYWRYLFRRWAEVQRFTPELHYEDTPYASFNLMGRTHWDPY